MPSTFKISLSTSSLIDNLQMNTTKILVWNLRKLVKITKLKKTLRPIQAVSEKISWLKNTSKRMAVKPLIFNAHTVFVKSSFTFSDEIQIYKLTLSIIIQKVWFVILLECAICILWDEKCQQKFALVLLLCWPRYT